MRTTIDTIRRLEYWVAGLILLAGLVLVCLQIFGRSFLEVSLLWSEELSRYLLIWTTYIGAVAATHDRAHIRVEFVLTLLPEPARRAVEIVVAALCLGFCGVLVHAGINLVQDSIFLGLMSAASNLPVPIWVFQAIVPAGFALMGLRFALRIIALARGSEMVAPVSAVAEDEI